MRRRSCGGRGRAIVSPFLLLLLVGLVHVQPGLAAPIRVLTYSEYRIGQPSGSSVNFNFYSGNAFSMVRGDLLDPSLFGAGGIVPRPVEFATPVDVFTPGSLVGVDVVVIASLVDTAVTAAERDALEAFVAAGGGLFVFANDAAADLAAAFPGASAGSYTNTASGWVSNATSPLATGPFGTLALNTAFSTGYAGSFAALGSEGTEGLRNAAGVLGASFVHGAGRAVLINDEEMFMNAGQPGYGVAHLSPTTRTIFRNSFAYVVPAEGWNAVVPEPATTGWVACAAAAALLAAARCERR